tara:strand:+ start:299 stop:640 length:342 start_codon:yes stop_codon:yes gene_type:complete
MDNTLFMLTNPKKTKKTQSNMDGFVNSYELHTNNIFQTNLDIDTNSENNSETNSDIESEKSENVFSDEFNVIIQHFNSIDTYILNCNNNDEFEILNNYLIDLLFLIKSKKSKK